MEMGFHLRPKLEHPFEKNREGFNVEELRKAQMKSWAAYRSIRALLRPGVSEEEIRLAGDQILKEMGCVKNWHRLYVRFGENTLLQFGEPSSPDIRLKENDIAYLDLGPVWKGSDGMLYEGDVGDTIAVGTDEDMRDCAEAARELFKTVAAIWRNESLTGTELYARASAEARKRGYLLHAKVDGHRAGDFPHQIFYKGGMGEVDFKPSADIWILEIQIRHPTRNFGAFFEDTLE